MLAHRAGFQTTRWSLIARASLDRTPDARDALAELYHIYAYPLYAFVRHRGESAEKASDIVQGFFVELLEGSLLRSADQTKGRFRSFLLGALKHFLADERDRETAKKRGGGTVRVSLDDAESRYGLEPSHELTPERLFEWQWALATLEHVVRQLKDEYERAGKQRTFDVLKDLLAGPLVERSYLDIAAALDSTEGAVKVAVHRMRRRYREILLAQIAETVETEDDIEDEIRCLYAALGGGA